ncbi:MAG: dynamin family protein [Candidatus Dormibacteria bacterium]
MASGLGSALGEWQRRREGLVDRLRRLGEFIGESGDQAVAADISGAAERLSQGRLTLAVLGEFKRGKSTLINSLLEAPVLPVGVVPMTSVPLRVEYSEEAAAEVQFETGSQLSIGLDELFAYGTETGNPHNRKGVAGLSIRHPAAILRQGVILVDTPGIGSVHAHNTQVAYDHLRHADAAIFVLSIDSPASLAEVEFLKAAREQVGRIFFVLNKADLLTPEELQQSAQFVRGVLTEAGGSQDLRLFPLSARFHDRGYTDLVAALEHFLVQERGEFLLARAQAVARRGVGSGRNAINLERAALSLSSADSAHRVALLDERLTEIGRRRLEVEENLAGDLKRLVALVVDPSLGRFRQAGSERVAEIVEVELASPAPDRAHRLERALARTARELVGVWLTELEGELDAGLTEVALRHSQRTNQLISAALRLVSEVLHVELAELTLTADLAPASQRIILVDDQVLALELVSSALKRLVPGRLGVDMARRDAQRRGEELVDRHCGRVRHDVLERLSARETAWRGELRQSLEGVEQSVQRATEIAAKAQSEGGAAVARQLLELDRRSLRLEALAAGLASEPPPT